MFVNNTGTPMSTKSWISIGFKINIVLYSAHSFIFEWRDEGIMRKQYFSIYAYG